MSDLVRPMGSRAGVLGSGGGRLTLNQLASFSATVDNFTFIPPDTMGAVGPNHLFVTHNSEVRIQTKTGTFISSTTLTNFWSSVLVAGAGTSDPKVFFDQDSGRFIFTTLSIDPSPATNNRILLAVSATNDPTGAWYLRSFVGDPTFFADYDSLGVNHNWIVVSANMFNGNSFLGVKLFVFNKSFAINPGPISPILGNYSTIGFDNTGFGTALTMQPALTFDNSQTTLYLVDSIKDSGLNPPSGWVFSGNSYVRLSQLTGPVNSPTWSLVPCQSCSTGNGYVQVAVNFSAVFPDAPQPGSAAPDCVTSPYDRICTNDGRLLSSVFRNGKLWFTFHAGLSNPNRTSVFWYQTDTTVNPPVIVQQGVIDDPITPTFYYYPSIAVDTQSNAGLGFTASSVNSFAGAYYTGRRFSDPLGTMNALALSKAGEHLDAEGQFLLTPSNRWGDFSATTVDPSNAVTFWTIQEYAESANADSDPTNPPSNNAWGTWWTKFSLVPSLPNPPSGFTATTLGISSITWTWNTLANADYYNIYYTTSPTVLIASSTSPGFTFTGLLANTTYGINVTGVNALMEGPQGVAPSTSTLAIPLSGGNVSVFLTSVTATYTTLPPSPRQASCFGYSLDASTAADFSGAILSSATGNVSLGSLTVTGLNPNTRYFLRLGTLNNLGGENPIPLGPTIPFPAPFSNVTASQIQANWTGISQSGFQYLAQASTASNFTGTVLSSQTANLFAIFTSLSPNTTYFAQVSALGGPFTSLGSTSTLAAPPLPASPPFTAVFTTSMTVTWLPNGNPLSVTTYTVVLTTGSVFPNGFAGNAILNTAPPGPSPSATLAGLTPNSTYFLFVAAINNNGIQTSFTAMGSSVTLTNSPGPASFTAVFQTSATLSWSSGGNSPKTFYTAQVSSVADFSSGVFSQTAQSLFFTPTGLLMNTTYYAQVSALNFAGAPSPPVTAVTATLTLAPGPAVNPFVTVTTSITVQWIPLALSPQSATCEGYRVEASTAPDFSGQIVSNTTSNPAASVLGVSGLLFSTTYYVRVGALNWESAASYLVIGATETALGCISSGTVTNQAPLVLSVCSRFAQITFIQMQVPISALPTGTPVSMAVNDAFVITTQYSDEATLSPLGPTVDFQISTPGQQPSLPVSLLLTYNPSALPPGSDPAKINMARFVAEQNQWSLLPTVVDTNARSISALTLHFSFFAPFLVSAATALDSIQMFPVPWEPGSGDPTFDAPKLTFSNLPANTKVRLYTILGESVWGANSNPGGVLFWDGTNQHGNRVGSGTYLAVIEGGGSRRVFRVVVIR